MNLSGAFYFYMSEQKKDTQPDKDLAADQHPRPSQAEGDEETVEQDLAEKEKGSSKS